MDDRDGSIQVSYSVTIDGLNMIRGVEGVGDLSVGEVCDDGLDLVDGHGELHRG